MLNKVSDPVERFQLECCEIAFESLFSKCFIDSLAPNVSITHNKEVIAECTNYAKKAIRNAGGISILTNAIENVKDPFKKEFLTDFSNACVEFGNALSVGKFVDHAVKAATEAEDTDIDETDIDDTDDIADEEDSIDDTPDDVVSAPEMPKAFAGKELSEIQLDTRISDADIAKLKKAADKVELDNVSKIVSDKVANVIQAEKVTRYKLDEEKERLKQALIDDETNAIDDDKAAESAMESLIDVPLARYDVRTHQTLFSTLQRRAVEALMSYKLDSDKVHASDVLTEITVNCTTEAFKPESMSFYSAATKAIEMTVANECSDPESMKKIVSNATTFATIIYTLIELMHTMSLHTCTPGEVKNICTKDCNVTSVNDVACVINKNASAAIENNKKNIFKMASVEDVENAISDVKVLKGNLIDAKESSGIPIDQVVFDKLDDLIQCGEQKIVDIENNFKSATESAMIDRISRYKEEDIYRLNNIARAIKYKTFDNIKFRCKEAAGGNAMFAVEACMGKTPVYTSELNVVGMESATPERYIQYLVQKSSIKSVIPRGEQPDYCAIVGGHTYEIK